MTSVTFPMQNDYCYGNGESGWKHRRAPAFYKIQHKLVEGCSIGAFYLVGMK